MKLSNYFAFSEAYQELSQLELPLRTAYKLSKLAAFADTQVQFYRKQMSELLNKYCLHDDNGNFIPSDNGNGYKIDPEKADECNKAITDLENLDVDDAGVKLTLDELDGITVKTTMIQKLLPFLSEE